MPTGQICYRQYMELHPQMLGHLPYTGDPTYRNVFPYTGVPQQYTGMHSHIPGYPNSIWECISMWGTPYGECIPIYWDVRGIHRRMHPERVHLHMLGYPGIWECIPIYWGPTYIGMHAHIQGYLNSLGECIPKWGSPI
jgi:hypothetical protein